jgi:DNA-binding CsgD family transcriptional regulator
VVEVAWRGQEKQAEALMAATRRELLDRGQGAGLSVIEWGSALLACAGGRYEQALHFGRRASEPGDGGVSSWALVEVIEASSRLGDIEGAIAGLRRLSESTSAAGTNWALGVEARSRALVCDGQQAEDCYVDAIALLRQTRMRPELARAHLLYGEWLRRAMRRTDAREHLRTAHDMFDSMGARGFADRARRELLATGETARRRTVETVTDLTPQELQIANLAADFRQNKEIASELFLSPRTVEWHLRKVFAKLAVSSRRELRALLRPRAGLPPLALPGSMKLVENPSLRTRWPEGNDHGRPVGTSD